MNTSYRFNDFNPPIPFLTGDASVLHSIICEVDRVTNLIPEEVESRQATYLYDLMLYFSKKSFSFSKRLKEDVGNFSKNSKLSDLLSILQPEDKYFFQKTSKECKDSKVPKHHLPTHWAATSGSTGVPLKVQCTAITRAIGMAMVPWTHLRSGTQFSWKMASVKPTNCTQGEETSWDPASSLLFEVGPMLSISSSEDVFAQLDKLERFQPDILIVFPSVLKEYACLWESGGRKPLKLRIIRTMGESLCNETRQIVEELTGAKVLDTYSSSEVGRIATQVSPNSPYKVNTYSLIVEILNDKGTRCLPGEIGRVVITDLFNYATPLIRYDIGDWAIPSDTYHHNLTEVRGRSRNMITLPDGRKVWPLVGYREFSKIVPIRQFHIEQVKPDCLRARFSVDCLPNAEQRVRVKEVIRGYLGFPFEIEDSYQREPLPKGTNGKMEDFVSLL